MRPSRALAASQVVVFEAKDSADADAWFSALSAVKESEASAHGHFDPLVSMARLPGRPVVRMFHKVVEAPVAFIAQASAARGDARARAGAVARTSVAAREGARARFRAEVIGSFCRDAV
eukprot:2801851-Pleurochrysis_carterae.AAC.1